MSKLLPFVAVFALSSPLLAQQQPLLTGQAAYTDWAQQSPGIRHKITLADLPAPNPAEAVNNTAHIVPRPDGALPIAPAGFTVTLYAGGDTKPMQRADNTEHMQLSGGTFTQPRLLRTAPNGDLFVADSGAGKIILLRGLTHDGHAARTETFATGLDHPFGIAFYPARNPHWLYIGTATAVVRFPYRSGDLHATAAPQVIVPNIPGYAQLMGGGHWTRDVVFNAGKMLVSVGSGSNADDPDTHPREFHRADILQYTPEGKFLQVYASGIRNCVGEAVNPITHALWCSTNERDNLGNHLVPDYVTSVPEHSFFGWPWYYMGGHQDPRLPQPCADGTGPNPQRAKPLTADEAKDCKRVDLSKQVRTPDVIVQPHMASLQMLFYPTIGELESLEHNPTQGGLRETRVPKSIFPERYRGDAFAAEHGSWNRKNRAGYEVISIPMHGGHATGEYDDFLTGFVTKDGKVWGRPVGVTVGNDGSLYVTDDASRSVWRVAYTGK